jgi:hypothetical protein
MTILLTLDNKVIDARSVPEKNLEISGYFEGLKRDMIEQNEDIIDLSQQKPQFRFAYTKVDLFVN